MSDLKVGDRVRVVRINEGNEEERDCLGLVGTVRHCYGSGLCDVQPDGVRWKRTFCANELSTDVGDGLPWSPYRIATERCKTAAGNVAEAEAVVAQRRAELRAAWVAAIAALPPVPHAGAFEEVVAALREYLGPVAPFRANPRQEAAWWEWSGKARVGLRRDEEHLYLRVDAPDASLRTLCHLTGPEAVTTDAAVKAALTWLAERDVFLLETKENP